MKKVLVGSPICKWYDYCFDEFSDRLKELSYPNYDLFFVDNSKGEDFFNKVKVKGVNVQKSEHLWGVRDMVARDHNTIRQKALDGGYDYLLMLDQDVIPPKDVIEKLMSHDKDVTSALFFGHHQINGESKIMPFAWVFSKGEVDWDNTGYLVESEIWDPQVFKIAFAGMGCVLIKREVLEKVQFRYSKEMDAWDDRWLGVDVWANGFEYWLDNTVKCKHLYKDRPFDYWDLKKQGRN